MAVDPFDKLPFGKISAGEGNPFAHDPPAETAVRHDVCEAEGEAAVYTPPGYDARLPDRLPSVRVRTYTALALALSGFLAFLAACLTFWFAIGNMPLFAFFLLMSFVLPLIGLVFSISGWTIARHELLGMQRNLVRSENRGPMQTLAWLALGATGIGLFSLCAGVGWAMWAILGQWF